MVDEQPLCIRGLQLEQFISILSEPKKLLKKGYMNVREKGCFSCSSGRHSFN